jgi:hypothetical protein
VTVQHIRNVWQEGPPEGGEDEGGIRSAFEEELQLLDEIVVKADKLGLPLS